MKIGRIIKTIQQEHPKFKLVRKIFDEGTYVVINANEGVKKDSYNATEYNVLLKTYGKTETIKRDDVEILTGRAKWLFYLLFR